MKTKHLSSVLVVFAALLLAGCESVGRPLAERLTPPPPVVRTIEAAPDRVFIAASAALQAMGYTISRARPKSGEIDASGRLFVADDFRSSDQHSCRVVIGATPDGAAVVRLEVREASEERTNAGAMRQAERVVPEGGTHARFFEELQRRL